MVDANILLKRIGSRQRVVPVSGGSPDETSSPIGFPTNDQEGDLKIKIGGGEVIDEDDLVGVFCAFAHELAKHLGRTLGPISLNDLSFPAGRPSKRVLIEKSSGRVPARSTSKCQVNGGAVTLAASTGQAMAADTDRRRLMKTCAALLIQSSVSAF